MISQTISIVELIMISFNPTPRFIVVANLTIFFGCFFDLQSIGGFVAGGESLQAGAKGREGLVAP